MKPSKIVHILAVALILTLSNTVFGQSQGEFLVNNNTTGDQRNPAVTVLDDGGFLLTWSDSPFSAN